MRWRRFPFSSLPDPASGGVPLFARGKNRSEERSPAFSLRSFPKDGSPADRRIPFFRFFLFSLSLFRRQETLPSMMTDSDAPVFSFFSFFGKNGGNVLPEERERRMAAPLF